MRAALCTGSIATLLLCVAPLPAGAAMPAYFRVGSWDAFSGLSDDAQPVCGVGTTNPADGRSFSLRFPIGGVNVVFQAKKPTWGIPNGTQISLVLQVDGNPPWNLQAAGNGQVIEWSLDSNAMQMFDAQFRRGSWLNLSFPGGSEPPWTLALNGSTAISNAFGRCVTDLTQRAGMQGGATSQGPTQPYSQPTAPSPPATQAPAAQSPPMTQEPTQPVAPGGTPASPR